METNFGFMNSVDKVIWPLYGDLSADVSRVSLTSVRILMVAKLRNQLC